MSSDVFIIRNGDGEEIGPCSGQTIAVLIREGVITADASIVSGSRITPITQVATFAQAFGVIDDGPQSTPLARILFTSDLATGDGASPLGSGDLGGSGETSLTAPVVERPLDGTIQDVLGREHTIIDPWFAGVLVGLWRRRETAVLEVEANGLRTTIYLSDGTPVFASNGSIADTLGRLLIRMGRITEDQLEQAIMHYIEHHEGTNKRVGEVLVELGMVTPEQVSEALHIQTREKILSCFSWTELRYRIQRDPEEVRRMPRFDCPVPSLLEDGIRRHYDKPRVDRVLSALATYHPDLSVSRPELAEVLARELPPGGTRSPEPEDGDDEALADAFDQPEQQQQPSQAGRSLWAEASFKTAKRLQFEKPMAAIEKLKRAVKLRPDALEYQAMLAYLEYRVAKTSEESTKKAEEARALAARAIAQDRKIATAHTILGHFEKRSGNDAAALDHFRRALSLDASDQEAKEEFRLLRTVTGSDATRRGT